MVKLARWKASRDNLFRGDDAESVSLPTPGADSSIVRHVLYLGGAGRESPYLSTTESSSVAEHFAGHDGRIWKTMAARANANGIGHTGKDELLFLLKGAGKGAAKWHSAFEVMQARRYVEEWLEHLLDFRALGEASQVDLRTIVDQIFER